MVPWRSIESVFLDMDGTLLDLHFDNHFWREHVPLRYAERHNMGIDTAKSVLFPKFRRMEGTIEWYCVEYWSEQLDLDIAKLKREINHLITVHEHVTDFLQRTRQSGKRVVMLTNAHSKSLDLKMEITGLGDAFDALICAHDIGYPKEDLRFWLQLVRDEPFQKDRTLFIDDSLSVLRTARKFGIRHIVAMRKPDSKSPGREIGEFNAIDSFDDIMPDT
jgi:HAD superfamily hydrolase (TIGR01509 family)